MDASAFPPPRLPRDAQAKAANLYEEKMSSLRDARNAGGERLQGRVFMS
jgi:hypothetical protein